METKDYLVIAFIAVSAIAAGGYSIYQYIDGVNKDNKTDSISKQLIDAQKESLRKSDELAEAQRIALQATAELKDSQSIALEKADQIITSNNALIAAQAETIKTIYGHGFARVLINRNQGDEITTYLQSVSLYPMHNVDVTVIDYNEVIKCNVKKESDDSVIIERSCYMANAKQIVESRFTLAAEKLQPLNYTPPERVQNFLLFKVTANHITTYQYSIFEYDKKSKLLTHAYKIFQVDMKGNMTLLEDNSPNISEKFWKDNFYYKKKEYLQGFD